MTHARTCDICGKPFSESEWENRHEFHDEDCPNYLLGWGEEPDVLCDCDYVAHDWCCRRCNQ